MIDPGRQIEIERCVLATILQDGRAEALGRIKSGWLLDSFDRRLFIAMNDLAMKNLPIDLVTLTSVHPELDPVMVVDVQEKALVTQAQLDSYIGLLSDFAKRSKLLKIGERIGRDAANMDISPSETAGGAVNALKSLDELSQGSGANGLGEGLVALYDVIFSDKPRDRGIATGLKKLDGLIDGYVQPRMYVVGARPSVGKTVFGMIAAIQAAKKKKRVLYVNREMDEQDMLIRMMAHVTTLPIERLKDHRHDDMESEIIIDGITLLAGYRINLASNLKTPDEIYREAEAMANGEEGLGMVVIDYLQRLQPDRRFQNRSEEIGSMSWKIKEIAMDFKVPVILLSQLNRNALNRRPTMADLRESGDIEQDADVVILLHRPDYDQVMSENKDDFLSCPKMGATYLEIIVDKNRHGRCDLFPVGFMGDMMRYHEF